MVNILIIEKIHVQITVGNEKKDSKSIEQNLMTVKIIFSDLFGSVQGNMCVHPCM